MIDRTSARRESFAIAMRPVRILVAVEFERVAVASRWVDAKWQPSLVVPVEGDADAADETRVERVDSAGALERWRFPSQVVELHPTEGEGFTQAGDYLVDSVPLPPSLRAALEDFVAQHLSQQQPFFKRERKRADPEALGRRDPAKSQGEGKR